MNKFISVAMMALAVKAEWSVLYPNVMDIAMGVAVSENGTVYVSGAHDGSGAAVVRSMDKGASWETTQQHSMEGMYLDIGFGSAEFGAVGGLGMFNALIGSASTTDGYNFYVTGEAYLLASCMSVGALGNSTMFLVGDWQSSFLTDYYYGIRKSVDGGSTFEHIPMFIESRPRYGAFLDENTWFISCGVWPTTSVKSVDQFELSQYVTIDREHASIRINLEQPKTNNAARYIAEIYKTTDGGKTFERLYLDYDRFYFNGIDCVDESHCVAVAEGTLGGYILVTVDGGATWQETGFFEGAGLFNVDMVDSKEGWAVGAFLSGQTFNAAFLHTMDGGFSWQTGNEIAGAWPNAVSVVSSNEAYASAFLRQGGSSILGYSN